MIKLKVLRDKKIYIAGHRGMVGSALLRYFKNNKIKKLIYVDKKQLNLLDKRKVNEFIKKTSYNCKLCWKSGGYFGKFYISC